MHYHEIEREQSKNRRYDKTTKWHSLFELGLEMLTSSYKVIN